MSDSRTDLQAVLDRHRAQLQARVRVLRGELPEYARSDAQEHTEPTTEYTVAEAAGFQVGQVRNGYTVVAVKGDRVAIADPTTDDRVRGNRNRSPRHRWYNVSSPILARKLDS